MHITVGVSAIDSPGLESELRLVKTAILYGDTVTLCSVAGCYAMANFALSQWTGAQSLAYIEELLPNLFANKEEIQVALEICRDFQRIDAKRGRTGYEQQEWVRMSGLKAKIARQIEGTSFAQQKNAITQLLKAKKAGILKMAPFASPTPLDMIPEFTEQMRKALGSVETIPLLDQRAGEFIRSYLAESDISEVYRQRLRPVSLAKNIFEQFPAFDLLPMDEVLDIRRSLDKALTAFRSQMAKSSDKMRGIPWDKDFADEAQVVYDADIATALSEVEALCTQDVSLRAILASHGGRPDGSPSIGLALGNSDLLPQIAAMLAAGKVTSEVALRMNLTELQTMIQDHQLYYCYEIKRASENL